MEQSIKKPISLSIQVCSPIANTMLAFVLVAYLFRCVLDQAQFLILSNIIVTNNTGDCSIREYHSAIASLNLKS